MEHVYKLFPKADLKRYARNARTHTPVQIAKLAASIREYGFTNPCLVDEAGQLIAGHGRLEAALQIPELTNLPCIVLNGLTDAQKKALVLADNRIAEDAGWDFQLLKSELSELRALDFDLSLTGFGMEEIAGFLDEITPVIDTPEGDPEELTPAQKCQALLKHDAAFLPIVELRFMALPAGSKG